MTALPRLFFLLLIIVLMSLPLRAEDGDDASDDPHHSHREGRQALPLEELQMFADVFNQIRQGYVCLLYTSPSPRDKRQSRMPSSA